MIDGDAGINYFWKRLKHQFASDIIMNWSNVHKCILVLVLTFGVHLLWIIWKLFIIFTPSIWQSVNLPLVTSQIYVNTASTFFVIGLIIFCYRFQNKRWANTILPHFMITFFILMFIVDGFLVGIYSPATIFAIVCISGVGMILFNRKFVYFHIFNAFFICMVLMYLTYESLVPYAPIFSRSLLNQDPHRNQFWVLSMMYFIIPILIACLILCEILLSQWRRREALIKNLSQTDPLTNLYNRRFFNEKLNLIQQMQINYTIILMDVDHFKEINDAHGHLFGDQALQKVATLLSSHVRHSDIVARYGGEEFIIAMPETSLDIAYEIAERCRFAIENQILDESQKYLDIRLTASFGVASSTHDTDISKIIHLADQALYFAKQHGRNQVQLYNDQITA